MKEARILRLSGAQPLFTVIIKVGSYEPISIQITLKICAYMMENVGVHTI